MSPVGEDSASFVYTAPTTMGHPYSWTFTNQEHQHIMVPRKRLYLYGRRGEDKYPNLLYLNSKENEGFLRRARQ